MKPSRLRINSIRLRNKQDVARVRQVGHAATSHLGFTPFDRTRITTAMIELARNVVSHGEGGRMALHLASHGERAELASKNYEKECWNEEFGYYCGAPLSYKGPPRPITPAGAKFGNRTYGGQCFIDQLCAVGLSTAAGLGNCFDPAHEAMARRSILKHNTIGPQQGTLRLTALGRIKL